MHIFVDMMFKFILLVSLQLVTGEPLVFILPPSTESSKVTTSQRGKSKRHRRASFDGKSIDFGRQLDITEHLSFLADKTGKLSRKLEEEHERADAKTDLLDFDLEDIFTRRLGKGSKSKSGKSSSWKAGKNGKSSKSELSKSELSKSKPSASSASKSAKKQGHRASSVDFSYQIGSYGLWSADESRDSTLPETELLTPSTQAKAAIATSQGSVSSASELVPAQSELPGDTILVSELANLGSNSLVTPDETETNETTIFHEGLRSNSMYYIAGAALFGGLLTLFAAVFLKRKIKPDNTHTKLNETTSQDDTEDSTPSLGCDTATPENGNEEWRHHDSWLAFDMRA